MRTVLIGVPNTNGELATDAAEPNTAAPTAHTPTNTQQQKRFIST
jgi:hypothetical protein